MGHQMISQYWGIIWSVNAESLCDQFNSSWYHVISQYFSIMWSFNTGAYCNQPLVPGIMKQASIKHQVISCSCSSHSGGFILTLVKSYNSICQSLRWNAEIQGPSMFIWIFLSFEANNYWRSPQNFAKSHSYLNYKKNLSCIFFSLFLFILNICHSQRKNWTKVQSPLLPKIIYKALFL